MGVVDNVIGFCDSSTIHGVNFWTNTKSILAKLLWVIIVLTGIGAASFMIWNNFQTWAANPVVVSVVQVPIEQAPYPSVTVCPMETSPLGSVEVELNNAHENNAELKKGLNDVLEMMSAEMMKEYVDNYFMENQNAARHKTNANFYGNLVFD